LDNNVFDITDARCNHERFYETHKTKNNLSCNSLQLTVTTPMKRQKKCKTGCGVWVCVCVCLCVCVCRWWETDDDVAIDSLNTPVIVTKQQLLMNSVSR